MWCIEISKKSTSSPLPSILSMIVPRSSSISEWQTLNFVLDGQALKSFKAPLLCRLTCKRLNLQVQSPFLAIASIVGCPFGATTIAFVALSSHGLISSSANAALEQSSTPRHSWRLLLTKRILLQGLVSLWVRTNHEVEATIYRHQFVCALMKFLRSIMKILRLLVQHLPPLPLDHFEPPPSPCPAMLIDVSLI